MAQKKRVAAKKSPAKKTTKKPAKKAKSKKPAKVSWLPKNYPVMSVTTALENCAGAIDWYKRVLGAKERLRLDMGGGMVAHCELGFGSSVLMMGSPMPPQYPAKKACLAIYVKNCDEVFARALAAGAKSIQEPADQFYGDRSGRIEDPFGNEWTIGTHIKDVTKRQMVAAMAQMGG